MKFSFVILILILFSKFSFSQNLEKNGTFQTHSSLPHTIYSDTFRLRDGSELTETSSIAVSAMLRNAKRLLSLQEISDQQIPNATRALSDAEIFRLVFLAVAGNFVVDHAESAALPQRCALVVNPGSGGLVLRDNLSTQSVVLEVLVIVSIICLLRAWDGIRG